MDKLWKIVTVDKNGMIDVRQFRDFLDIRKIDTYEIVHTEKANQFLLKFYDKKGKFIPLRYRRSPKRSKKVA